MEAEAVPVELVRPLRRVVLRPGQPEQAAVFSGDDDPKAVHAAVRARGAEVVAVGSLLAEEPPSWLATWPGVPPPAPPGRWWRIRGMATAEQWRRRGLGRSVLALLLERATAGGGGVVWCHARLGALALYLRHGFRQAGEVFEEPGLGPHQAMWRVVPGPEQTPPSPEPRSRHA